MADPSEGEGATGVVACQLTLAAAAAKPGETVTALLQVSCSQSDAIELQEVEIEFCGVERIDTSWVQPTYRRSVPPINTDKRKVQRYVVQSRLQAATQGTFVDLNLRRFVIRFTLPAWLPPTFRGTAVRYLYYLQAVVKYRAATHSHEEDDGRGSSSSGSKINGVGGRSAEPGVTAGGVATRIPLHIWPSKLSDSSAPTERSPRLLSGDASGGSLLSPTLSSDDMLIKCWEIGPGTALQDAVAHIVKLASQPQQSSRPHSPAGRLGRVGIGGGQQGAGSSVGGDDSRSEISHDVPDGEAPAEELEPPPAVRVTPDSSAPAAALLKQQQEQQASAAVAAQGQQQSSLQSTAALSSGGTPHGRLAMRPPLRRASLEQQGSSGIPRSPSLLADGSSSFTLRSYALRIGDQPLARVSLHPPLEGSLQPGSTLAGTLDFSPHPQPSTLASALPSAGDGEFGTSASPASLAVGPSPRCVQVLILLETEELVEAQWRRQVQGGGSGGIRRVYDEQLEVTADTACTHFLFTIPPDAAASFQTPLVQLRWLLRFQFTASMLPRLPAANSGTGMQQIAAPVDWNPLQGRLEQLTWALPVTVLPPSS